MNPDLIETRIQSRVLGEGSIGLKLVEGIIGTFVRSAEAYAEAIVLLLVVPELEHRGGAMFDRRGKAIRPSRALLRDDQVVRIVAASNALVHRTIGECTGA